MSNNFNEGQTESSSAFQQTNQGRFHRQHLHFNHFSAITSTIRHNPQSKAGLGNYVLFLSKFWPLRLVSRPLRRGRCYLWRLSPPRRPFTSSWELVSKDVSAGCRRHLWPSPNCSCRHLGVLLLLFKIISTGLRLGFHLAKIFVAFQNVVGWQGFAKDPAKIWSVKIFVNSKFSVSKLFFTFEVE
jgi:hypothetical protein